MRHMVDEIRREPDGTLDEIVVNNCHVHLENMDDDLWWLGLTKDGKVMHIWIKAEKGLQILVRENEIGAVGTIDA